MNLPNNSDQNMITLLDSEEDKSNCEVAVGIDDLMETVEDIAHLGTVSLMEILSKWEHNLVEITFYNLKDFHQSNENPMKSVVLFESLFN